MAESKPKPSASSEPVRQSYRVTLRHGDHAWTFSYTTGDVDAIVRRAAELARDADAPFDGFDAQVVRAQVQRLDTDSDSSKNTPGNSKRSA